MKRLFFVLLGMGAVTFRAAAEPLPVWENPILGYVIQPTNINAITFINRGWFIQTGLLPYETIDTLNYINSGMIYGTYGWRFEHTPNNSGSRGMAANFDNQSGGTVEAYDNSNSGLDQLGLSGLVEAPVDPSYLLVSATNIVNRGKLIVGANGLLKLTGKNIDLSRSTLEVTPVWGEAVTSGYIYTGNVRTEFVPDLGVYDQYWVQDVFTDNYRLNHAGLWNGLYAQYPAVPSPPSAPGAAPSGTMFNPASDSYVHVEQMLVTVTNFVGNPTNVYATNIYTSVVDVGSNYWKGAVFVGQANGMSVTTDSGVGSPENGNFHRSIGVRLSVPMSNSVNMQLESAYIYVLDELATHSEYRGLVPNRIKPTSRPMNYTVSRQTTNILGTPGGNGIPKSDFFTSAGVKWNFPGDVMSDSVTNLASLAEGTYAAYGAFFDNVASRPLPVAGATITNMPGRIEIRGDTVNLTDTRIRGEGLVMIKAPHLIASTNTVIDCESLNLNLGSTNGHLKVQSLVPGRVGRLSGDIYVWSGLWQNDVTVVLTNYAFYTNEVYTTNVITIPDPPGTTNVVTTNSFLAATNAFMTNAFTINYYAFMVDAQYLSVVKPAAYVHEFATTSPDVTINDSMSVVESFKVDGRSLTINGALTFPGIYPMNPITLETPLFNVVENWDDACAPNLLYFTNNGSISVPNTAAFGQARSYATFVNNGMSVAYGILVNSDYFENRGSLNALASLSMRGKSGKLDGGSSSSGFNSYFECDNLKINNYHLMSTGLIYLSISNSLADAGTSSGNLLETLSGIELALKPKMGDLLGTTVKSIATGPVVELRHVWAGENRGTNAAGFMDNAAIGKLVLASQSALPTFRFMGEGSDNAIYVDQLDLSGIPIADIPGCIEIVPGMKVYYASLKLPVGYPLTVTSGNLTNTPEEQLDGALSGRLRWVQNYAGANSGTAVAINGRSYWVNKALANSQIIDSDGDGVPNYYDIGATAPAFNATALTVVKNGQGTLMLDYTGQTLLVGLSYSMTATAADGFTFSNWSSNGVAINSPTIAFTMRSNLVLTANFAYTATAGTYAGLFYQEPLTNSAQWQYSGAFTLKTTSNRKYSGSLQMSKSKYSFSGVLGAGGAVTNTVARKNSTPLVVKFQVGNDEVNGTVGDQAGSWTAQIRADRAVYGKGNTAPYAGNYTILFPGVDNSADTAHPQGDGFASVAVSTSGKVKFSGSLADGTKVSRSAIVSKDGQWPLYLPLYSCQGQMLGWMAIEDSADEDMGGMVSWIKQPCSKARYYPGGFDIEVETTGSAYDSTRVPVTGFTGGTVSLYGGNLTSGITNEVAISSGNKVTSTGANKFALKLDKSRGLFKGSLRDAAGRKVSFNGAILQKQKTGSGYFLGTDQSGSVTFEP